MRILIVEDQRDVLECLRGYFRERGHEVMTACTEREALEWLSGSQPQLAFIDLMLPRGHGRAVIQEIARNDGEKVTPTRMVVITACDDLQLRKEMLALGVTDYLFKPLTLRDLDALLETVPAPAPIPQPENKP